MSMARVHDEPSGNRGASHAELGLGDRFSGLPPNKST